MYHTGFARECAEISCLITCTPAILGCKNQLKIAANCRCSNTSGELRFIDYANKTGLDNFYTASRTVLDETFVMEASLPHVATKKCSIQTKRFWKRAGLFCRRGRPIWLPAAYKVKFGRGHSFLNFSWCTRPYYRRGWNRKVRAASKHSGDRKEKNIVMWMVEGFSHFKTVLLILTHWPVLYSFRSTYRSCKQPIVEAFFTSLMLFCYQRRCHNRFILSWNLQWNDFGNARESYAECIRLSSPWISPATKESYQNLQVRVESVYDTYCMPS